MAAPLAHRVRAPAQPSAPARADKQAIVYASRPASLVSTSSSSSCASSGYLGAGSPTTDMSEAGSPELDSLDSQRTVRAPFPSASSSTHQAVAPPLPKLMRLRRVSMPIVPLASDGRRTSVASVASSFDSLPEETEAPVAGPSRPRPSLRRTAPTEPVLRRPLSLAAQSSTPAPRPVSFASDIGPKPRLSLPVEGARRRKVSMRRAVSDRPPAALLSEEERARRDADAVKRRHIIRELVDTERAYVAVLSEIDDHYLRPLLLAAASTTPILDRKAIADVFANFADILALARELLRRLVHGASTPPPSLNEAAGAPFARPGGADEALEPAALTSGLVGALVLPLCPFLKCYAPFVQNFSRALERIESERTGNARWRRFLDERARRGVGRGLGLGAMLLQVVQRIPRYLLMLGDLVRRTPEDDADRYELVQAHGIVEGVATFLEGMIAAHERTIAALDLQRAFGSSLGDLALVAPGRELIRSGRLIKVCRRGEQERAFFLFSDMLLCAFVGDQSTALGWSRVASVSGLANLAASPVLGASAPAQYTLNRRIDLEDVTVVGVEGHYFEIRTSTKSFAVAAGASALSWVVLIGQIRLSRSRNGSRRSARPRTGC